MFQSICLANKFVQIFCIAKFNVDLCCFLCFLHNSNEAFEKLLREGEQSTLDSVFTILAWSFNALLEGTFPHSDWNGRPFPASSEHGKRAGKPLANGYYGVVCSLVGDLDYLNKTLGLPHHGRKDSCCSMCKATGQGGATWKAFQVNAQWRNLIWSPAQWQAWPGKSKCCIFGINHLTAANVAGDWMHNKYLGHDQYALGSVVYLLIYHLMKEGSVKKNLAFFGHL